MDQRIVNHGIRILVTAALLMSVLSGCAPAALRNETNSIQEFYRTHDKPDFQFSQHGVLKLRYLETGDTDKSTVVLIHGTPGSWAFLANYVNDETLQQDAHLFAIDRPVWLVGWQTYFSTGECTSPTRK